MTRIAKSDAHAAIDLAARHIRDAGGTNNVTSRKEIKDAVKSLPEAEKALTEHFYRFIDARDAATNSRVTGQDIDRAVTYAKAKIIDAYDVNQNGLSANEIGQMSKLGKLAVELAKELKKTGAVGTPSALDTAELGRALETALTLPNGNVVEYMSEGDYPVVFTSAAGRAPFSGDDVLKAFQSVLEDGIFADEDDVTASMTAEMYTAADTREALSDLTTPYDPNDADELATTKAFGDMKRLLDDNLTDVRLVKIGPKNADGSLATDQGLYAVLIVGATRDGQLAGVMYGSVET